MPSPIKALAEEVQSGFGNFSPENVLDMEGMFEDLPEFFEAFRDGVRTLGTRFGEQLPIDPKVAEAIMEVGATLSGLADHCREMRQLFETAHATELERLRNPRPQEKIWDVSQNQ